MDAATRTSADVAAVRGLPWFRDLAPFARALAGLPEQDDVPIALLCRRETSRRPPVGSRIRTLPRRVAHAPLYAVGSRDSGVYVAAPALYLLLRACDLPLPLLAAVACALCGTYESHPESESSSTWYNTPPKADIEELRGFAASLPSTAPGTERLRSAVTMAGPSRSPMETALAVIAACPPSEGGMGLPAPEINPAIDLGTEGRRLLGNQHSMAVDLFWPEAGFGIEYDSGQFHTERERQLRDKQRQVAADLLGITTLPWTWELVNDEAACELGWRSVARHLGARPRWDERSSSQRRALRKVLLGPHNFW